MNGTFFYLGLGLGLALACGLRPYLPALLAAALASASVLGVSFSGEHYRFLDSTWWALAVAVVLVASYALQLRLGAQRFDSLAGGAVAAQAVAVGALLFAGTLAAHGDTSWPGLIAGAGASALARMTAAPVIAGARERLTDHGAREALTVYLDAVAVALAVVVALVHPFGYVALVLIAWFAWRSRARMRAKHAGLRILRR